MLNQDFDTSKNGCPGFSSQLCITARKPCGSLFNSNTKDVKATFNFNVQIDGSKSVITMDGDNIKDLDMDTLVALGKLFQWVQTKVSLTLEKLYADKTDGEQEAPLETSYEKSESNNNE